ncbi:MAG: anti-sigma factor family protein [Candidatus Sulfotelmatobacter sp.]
MACADKVLLLHAYVDGELDLVRSLEVEEHLKTCPACAEELSGHRTLRNSLRSGNVYRRAPEELKARIRTAATGERAAAPEVTPSVPVAVGAGSATSFRPAQRRPIFEWLAVAAAILIAFAVGSRMVPGIGGNSRAGLIAEEAVASHVRSLQPGHLMDIQSTDQHTVKPWFDGKLDFSPPVTDFSDQGFPLIGGRLDYIDHRNVAALVYQRRKHLISVFVWPESSGPNFERQRLVNGYTFLGWQHGGMDFCTVSDVGIADLGELKALLDR